MKQVRGLEERAETEEGKTRSNPARTPCETLLLLSFIYTMQGEPELAYQAALEGTRRGESLDSPFVSAVGYMRQGHAWMLARKFQGTCGELCARHASNMKRASRSAACWQCRDCESNQAGDYAVRMDMLVI